MALTGYRHPLFPPTGIFGIQIVGENANVLRIGSAVEVGARCIADGVFVPLFGLQVVGRFSKRRLELCEAPFWGGTSQDKGGNGPTYASPHRGLHRGFLCPLSFESVSAPELRDTD